MNKKIFFSILIIFICLFSCSSVFGASDHGFTIEFIEQCIENYSSEIKAYIDQYNCKNYIVRSSGADSFVIMFSDGSFSLGSYYSSSTGNQGYCWFRSNGSWIDNTGSFGSSRPSYDSKNHYFHASSQSEISTTRINSLDILMGFIEPEPVQPFIEMSKTEYTENDSSVDLYLYSNDFDITNYGLVFIRYDGGTDSVGTTTYFSPLPSKWQEYYNSDETRYELNLKDFVDFSFSDVIFYNVGIFEYNSSGVNTPYQKTEYFKYKFSESYEVAPGGTFDITPIIYLSTDQPTSSLSVTITVSNISEGLIYYNIDGGAWQKYLNPFIIDKNCVINAHIYTSSGSSGYASRSITNIVSTSDISNRPVITHDDIGIIPLDNKGYYKIGWKWKNTTTDFDFLYSDNGGRTWYNFKNISELDNSLKRYMLGIHISSFPKILYFKYVNSQGISSDTITFTINSATSDSAIKDTIGNYDNSGEYIEDNLHDFTNKYDPVVNPNYEKQEGSSLDDLDFSSNDSLLQSALKTIPTTWKAFASFFSLMNGIWIFIPNIILELIFALIIIKFFIALIGFLKS